MGTITTQILVGGEHTYHGGINPSHYLFFSQNDRPAWMLVEENLFNDAKKPAKKITWIPTIENMLEDALLMIAIYVLKDKKICDFAKKYLKNKKEDWAELYEDIDKKHLEELHKECRKLKSDVKLVLTVLKESDIKDTIGILKKYQFKYEVCTSQAE